MPAVIWYIFTYSQTYLVDLTPPIQKHLVQAPFLETEICLPYYTFTIHQSRQQNGLQ
jgi:hypothetical protein